MGLLIYPLVTYLRTGETAEYYAFTDGSTHGPARSGQEAINGLAAILREYGLTKEFDEYVTAADSVEALEVDAVERGEATVEIPGAVRISFRVDHSEDHDEQ